MRSRNFLIMTTVVGSALIGAGIAVTGHLASIVSQSGIDPSVAQVPQQVPQQLPQAALITSASQVRPSGVQASEPLFAPPPPSPNPVLTAVTPNSALLEPALSDSVSPLKTQLRRAIQERNFALLRSLIQAGSLREALRDIEVKEQVNFDNLDASTWTVLEKAINYHCHQAQNSETDCFESLP
jgi:hypothetical protein